MTPQYCNKESIEVNNDQGPMLNPQVVHIYFNYLKALMTRLRLHDKPNNIRNGDETGKQFEHQHVRVLAKKGSKSCRMIDGGICCLHPDSSDSLLWMKPILSFIGKCNAYLNSSCSIVILDLLSHRKEIGYFCICAIADKRIGQHHRRSQCNSKNI